jgi:hypothetical protein
MPLRHGELMKPDRRKEAQVGVEYEHYLIPEDNAFKPQPQDLRRLVDALLDGGLVARNETEAFGKFTSGSFAFYDGPPDTNCYVQFGQKYFPFPCPCAERDIAGFGERDYRMVWPVESSNESGLKYPLSPFPEWGDAYYELRLHMGEDFVYHTSESIDPFDEVACACGVPLELPHDLGQSAPFPPVFFDQRIRRTCPSCGRAFRPQELVATVRDVWTGESLERPGGATYLFAVVIDCGKGFAREAWPIRASEEFMALVEKTLGQSFYEIGDIY